MKKERESITIDPIVNAKIKKEAKKQSRSFSGMIEYICKYYLMVKSGSKKDSP